MYRAFVIRVWAGVFWHYGVLFMGESGQWVVIEYAGKRRGGMIVMTPFAEFVRGRRWERVRYWGEDSPEIVARRALLQVGKCCYHVSRNNCEHFASWCATGRAHSVQVERVANGLRAVAVTGLCVVGAGLLLDACFGRKSA